MAHIQEGVITGTMAAYGFAMTGAMSVLTGRKFSVQNLSKVSMVTAAVFCASLLHFPLLGTSVHFTFVGLAGILLGPMSFLSVFVAVFFQKMLFQHGGFTTLGINAFNIGMAAMAGYYIFRLRLMFPRWNHAITVFGVLAGFGAAVAMVGMLAGTLFFIGFPLSSVAVVFAAHLPVMIGEGLATGFLAAALARTKRENLFHE